VQACHVKKTHNKNNTMKRSVYLIAAAILLYTTSCSNSQQEPAKTTAELEAEQFPSVATKQERIKRGEYLVAISGCNDCHTPKIMTEQGPAPDTTRLLSGYNSVNELGSFDRAMYSTGQWILFNGELTAGTGPWGTSFAANLTPDPTGMGGWTLDNFKTALRKGKYKGLENSRPLLPPMPWQNLQHMTDEDLESVFDYLQSLKPVNNRVPAPILAQR
jgi:hypothetical protein